MSISKTTTGPITGEESPAGFSTPYEALVGFYRAFNRRDPVLIQSRGKPRRLRRGRSARTAWPSRIWLSVRGFLLPCPT